MRRQKPRSTERRTKSPPQRRAEIDAAFADMANDPEYQKEALRMAEEFAAADWEAMRLFEAWDDKRSRRG